MKIYIASSWRHQHAVEMLTTILEQNGHEVVSWIRRSKTHEAPGSQGRFDVVEWIESEKGRDFYEYDLDGATQSDLVIYLGPSGCDAWAEVGAAWAANRRVYGLWAKGEQIGLMRRMATWFKDYTALLNAVKDLAEAKQTRAGFLIARK